MTPIKDYLLVPVPKGAQGFKCSDGMLKIQTAIGFRFQALPPGNWQYITTSDKLTEQQAAEIVESVGYPIAVYKNYEKPNENAWCVTAVGSFRSLLKSLNISRAVIVKKNV